MSCGNQLVIITAFPHECKLQNKYSQNAHFLVITAGVFCIRTHIFKYSRNNRPEHDPL